MKLNYLDFWGIQRPVFFQNEMDGIYLPKSRELFINKLENSCQFSNIFSISSEKGVGKTTVLKKLYDVLPIEKYETTLFVLSESAINSTFLVDKLCYILGMKAEFNYNDLLYKLDDLDKDNRRLVVIIDSINLKILDELVDQANKILDLNAVISTRLCFVLSFSYKDNEEERLVKSLRKNQIFNYKLERFKSRELGDYFKNKFSSLNIKCPFEINVINEMYKICNGITAKIDILAENCLQEAAFRKTKVISNALLKSVVAESGFKNTDVSASVARVLIKNDMENNQKDIEKHDPIELTKLFISRK